MDSIPLKLGTGKTVGRVEGGRAVIFVTSRNYFAAHRGYSVDEHVLDTIGELKCSSIVFRERDGLERWISYDEFCAYARPSDFGYGRKWTAPDALYQPRQDAAAPQLMPPAPAMPQQPRLPGVL